MRKERQIEELEKRISKLAQEKAQLALLNEMFANFEKTTTLDEIVKTILDDALALHGGQNVVLYYRINDGWSYKDLLGNEGEFDVSKDKNLEYVLKIKTNFDDVSSLPKEVGIINVNLDELNSCNSYFPLVAEGEVVAILLLEKRLIYSDSTFGDFSTFFNYAGIVLKNEIENQSRLRDAEIEFEQVFESNIDAMLLLDKDGSIRKFNIGFNKLLRPEQDFLGKNIAEAESLSFLNTEIKKLERNSEDHVEFDTTYYCPHTKETLYFICSISELRNNRKSVTGYVINIKDISNRVRVQQELSDSEEKYRSLAENAKQIILMHDLEGTIIYMNNFGLRFFGKNEKQMLGTSISQFLDEEEEAEKNRVINGFVSGKFEIQQPEVTITDKLGEEHFLEIIATPVYKENRIVSVLVIGNDVTEKRVAEQKINETNERLRLAAKASKLGYYELDPATNEVVWDNQLHDIFGLDLTTSINRNSYFQTILHPDDRIRIKKEFAESLIPNKENTLVQVNFRVVVQKQIKHIKINAYHFRDNAGNVERIIGACQDITQEKNAENEILESKERYRLLHENAGLGIGYYSTDGKVISYNEIAARNMGGKPEDYVGKSLMELFPKEAADEYFRRINASIISDTPITYEDYVPLPTDDYWFLSTYTKILDADNNISGIQIISSEISEQKKIQKALHDGEERFNLAMKASNDGLFDWDMIKNEIYFSPRWKEMLGYADHELENKLSVWEELTHSEDLKAAWKMQNEVVTHQRDKYAIEFRMKHKEGHWVEIWARAETVFDEKGKAIRMIGTHSDISESKTITRNLKESQEKYRSLLENLPVGVFRSNLSGKVLSANIAMAEIYGYASIEELLKRPAQNYYASEPREQMLVELIKKGYLLDYETEEYKKDGSVIWISANYRLHNYEANRSADEVYIDGVLSDITQKKLAEEELIVAKEKAEESDRLKSAFLANMSHEIRTPMNGILGFLDLMNDSKLTKNQQEQYLAIVSRSGERLLQTINDIIELSKIEAGENPVLLSDVNITELLEYLHQFFLPEVKAKNMELYLNMLSPGVVTLTDSNKLESILTNLIKNAIKFTSKGFIEVGFECVNENLRFYVKDTGKGIPEDKLKLVFERFVQADLEITRGYEGSGLGLSITKAYVKTLGGEIWVESEVNKGTTFYFEFDYQKVEVESTTKMDGEDLIMNEMANNKEELQILVAEDDEVSFALILTMLSKPELGIKLIRAQNGREAVQLYKENREAIALILMDIKMPVMDGLDATKEIRDFDEEIPIIAQTAFALLGDKEQALKAGCNDYISKPLKKDDLIKTIQKYLVKSHSSQL